MVSELFLFRSIMRTDYFEFDIKAGKNNTRKEGGAIKWLIHSLVLNDKF